MVVKSATKKKLMDMGIPEDYAHNLADGRKWDDVKILSQGEIAKICGLSSEEADRLSQVIQKFGKRLRSSGSSSTSTTVVRRRAAKRRVKVQQELEEFDFDAKASQLHEGMSSGPIFETLKETAAKEGAQISLRVLSDLAVSIESTDEIDSKKCELLVENVEKIIRRRFRHIPNTYYEEEVEHLLKFSSPREEGNIPCPYFDLRTELNEKEYNEFLSLRKNVKFHIECRIK